jgi:hypothetical protein
VQSLLLSNGILNNLSPCHLVNYAIFEKNKYDFILFNTKIHFYLEIVFVKFVGDLQKMRQQVDAECGHESAELCIRKLMVKPKSVLFFL